MTNTCRSNARIAPFVFTLTCCLCAVFSAKSQNYSNKITVDTTAGTIREGVPQDRNLIIYYPFKSKSVGAVNFYPVDNDGFPLKLSHREYRNYLIKPLFLKNNKKGAFFNLRLFLSNKVILSKDTLARFKASRPKNKFASVPLNDYRFNKKGDSLVLYSPPLDPNRQYRYLILHQKPEKDADKVYDMSALLVNGQKPAAEALFKQYATSSPMNPFEFDFGVIEDLNKPGSRGIVALGSYSQAKSVFRNYASEVMSQLTDEQCLKSILDLTFTDCNDCKIKYKAFIDSIDVFNRAIVNMHSASLNKFSDGLLSLQSNGNDKNVALTDYDQRVENLKKSITILRQMAAVCNVVQLEYTSKTLCSTTLTELADNIKKLENNLTALMALLTARKDYNQAVIDSNSPLFYDINSPGVGTNIFEFKTRNRNIINACFGLVTYGAVFDRTNFSQFGRFYDVAPFVGINVNLRPIDKNLPLRSVPNKSLWHRTAFFTGFSLNSVKDVSTREDFFSKSNMSLLLGGSYRLTNAIRINYGALLFKRFDTNPLLSRKTITASPFAGLNLDFDLRELMGDFGSIFKP